MDRINLPKIDFSKYEKEHLGHMIEELNQTVGVLIGQLAIQMGISLSETSVFMAMESARSGFDKAATFFAHQAQGFREIGR